ncbi:hypothetical protein B0H67DRAFT_658170 [Lasiosphaeris hirsuta]|uniref:Uncharacterized protein n=1 Tax=Lasiosphaeris hirsuta TaxID=260670 RepID=A0AA40AZX8_9PEZI|nr:hypothetical protein B0H67DRAFT_658170 [Lasiosphaeris hirsuta]
MNFLQQYIPFVYAPYLDIDSDIEATSSIPESENQDSDQGLYPIPPPLSSATYPRRLEILRNLWDELRAVKEDLRTVLDAEEQKWRVWNKTQKGISDWQIYLTNTRFVWCKKKRARFRYNVFSPRKSCSYNLHLSSCLMKCDEARGKMWRLRVEAARQLRELDELDQVEKLRRDSRSLFERLWMPNFMMEEIAIGRLTNPE